MVNDDWQTITVGGVAGAMIPAILAAEQPGTTAMIEGLPGPLSEKPVLGSLIVGGLGLSLAYLGTVGKGPIARNRPGIHFSAALGAASLGGAATMAMYPGGVAAAAGAEGVRVTIEEGEFATEPTPSGEVTLFQEEETEAATPSGETLGGI